MTSMMYKYMTIGGKINVQVAYRPLALNKVYMGTLPNGLIVYVVYAMAK